MGLFSGIRNLFTGRNGHAPRPFPNAAELFSGDTGPFASQVPIAPGMTAPNFALSTGNQPLFQGEQNSAHPQPALQHIYTFASLWNTATRTYSWRWDEAYAKSRTDALTMRRDCFLQSLLFERKFPTAQAKWHLEADDEKDPIQIATAAYIRRCIETLPNVSEALMQLLDAIWYGRAGVQIVWGWRELRGPDGQPRRSYVPHDVLPVNGDKVQYEWDGTPQIRLYGGVTKDSPESERRRVEKEVGTIPGLADGDTVWTDIGLMLRLKRPYWRDRFILHKHDCIDADWYESDRAGGVHGVGIRNWIYWYDWVRKEVATYLLEFMERVGTGFTCYYYDPSNPNDLAAAKQIAKQQGRNTWILWPRHPGESKAQPGVERIEPNVSGCTVLKDMLAYYDQYIERFVVGQTMSSGKDNDGGLGGTGRANFAQDTKTYVIKSDCLRLAGNLSRDLVAPLLRYNCPDARFGMRWKFSIDDADPEAKLKAGESLVKMGVPLKMDELRECGGFSKPADDDQTVGGQQPGMAAAGQKAPGDVFEGKPTNGQANGKPKLPGKDQEAKHDGPVRYQWEERARLAGLDPEKLTALAEGIMKVSA